VGGWVGGWVGEWGGCVGGWVETNLKQCIPESS